MLWNPIIRYNERMRAVPFPGNRIMPLLNGKAMKESLIDGCGLFTVFGWGILWGYQLCIDRNGNVIAAIPCDRKRAAIPTWRVGRIAITYLKGTWEN